MSTYTYRDLIRLYSDSIAKGGTDTDLNPREKRLTAILLNLASNAPIAAVAYPPSDQTRDDVRRTLGEIAWQGRPLVLAASPASGDAFERAIGRTSDILLNL